jgi:hypothetical protein
MSLTAATCSALLLNCTSTFNLTSLAVGLLNFTLLALSCPPDRSFVNSYGGCTCRPGWQIGTTMQGMDVCVPCQAGYYSAIQNSPSCLPCNAGQWSRAGSSQCDPCIGNSYTSIPGSAFCEPCPSDSTTQQSGLNTAGGTRCYCNLGLQEVTIGTGLNATMECHPCPSGAECMSQQGVALAQIDHWYDDLDGSAQFYPCPTGFCCLGDSNSTSGCATTDSNRCAPHREGFLCGVCEPGYASISGRECIECEDVNWPVMMGLLSAALVFIFLCIFENPSEDASTKLIVDYAQMCSLILNPRLGFSELLSIVHLDFGSASTQLNACIMPLPPLMSVSSGALAPLGLFILLFLIQLTHYLFSSPHCCISRMRPDLGERIQQFYRRNRWRYISAAWEITLFGFMAITSACVQLLDCRHIGQRFVVALAPSVECFAGAHFAMAIVALILLCILTFVVPVWLVAHLSHLSKSTERRSSQFLHSMKQIKTLKEEYERQKKKLHAAAMAQASSSGASAAVAAAASEAAVNRKLLDLDSYLARQVEPTRRVKRTGHEVVLWCYNSDQYWCEAWFLLRRVMFTLVTVLLDRENAAMLVVWFCLVNLVAHARFPVFRKRSSSYYHDVCLGAVAFQAALNLDVFAADPQGYVNLNDSASRAQVSVVYGVALLPIVVGVALFLKELLKERIRAKHTIVHKEEGGKEGADGANGSVRNGISDDQRKVSIISGPTDVKKIGASGQKIPLVSAMKPSSSPTAQSRASPLSQPRALQLGATATAPRATPAVRSATGPSAAAVAALAVVAGSPSDSSSVSPPSTSGAPTSLPSPSAVSVAGGSSSGVGFRPARLPRLHTHPTGPSTSSNLSWSTLHVLPSPSVHGGQGDAGAFPLGSPSAAVGPSSPSIRARNFGSRARTPMIASAAPLSVAPTHTSIAASAVPVGLPPLHARSPVSPGSASASRIGGVSGIELSRQQSRPIDLSAVMASLNMSEDSETAEDQSLPHSPLEQAAADVIAAPNRRAVQ